MRIKEGFFIQFIKLAGPFWNSENQVAIRLNTVFLIGLTVLQIVMAVVTTQWNADLFDAIEEHSMSGIVAQMGMLAVIFIGSITVTTTHLIVKRKLLIGWRVWLTDKVVSKWMYKGRYYQITFMSKDNHDNPDGRIAEDIRIATEDAIELGHSLFYSILLLGSFTKILWNLSGTINVDLGLVSFTMVGYMVWIAIVYAVCASILGWWMGKPLTAATNARQSKEANYRSGLIKAQEHAQAIAIIHGENDEQKQFKYSFRDIVNTYALQTAAWKQIVVFTSGYSVTSMGLPILVAAPRYIVGTITLGTLMQSVQAFQQMVAALSWPVNNLAGLASWRASVERVLSLVKALDDLENDISCRKPHQLCVVKGQKSVLKIENVSITGMEGQVLSANINEEIRAGEKVQIIGRISTAIKLFHAIADLWPWGTGRILVPEGEDMFFMPPKPYLPDGTLYDAICYPKKHEPFDRELIKQLLKLAKLEDLVHDLDRVDDWDQHLPLGHQQILGCIRVVLHKPKWLFIEEAFNALRADAELQILELLAKELPDTAIIGITRQATAEVFYQRKLRV